MIHTPHTPSESKYVRPGTVAPAVAPAPPKVERIAVGEASLLVVATETKTGLHIELEHDYPDFHPDGEMFALGGHEYTAIGRDGRILIVEAS